MQSDPAPLSCLLRFALIALALGAPLARSAPPAASPSLRDEMRQPWTRSDERFIRQWQVLGEVPLAATPDALAQDPFATAGGEASLNPATKTARLADGTTLTWRAVTAWGDAVDLSDGNGLKRQLVGYAAATIKRPAAGRARLCLASDEGCRVWLNGRPVAAHDGPRPLAFDEDQIEVDLNAGDNLLLIKVEQRTGGWACAARVLESGALPPRVQEIVPSFTEEPAALVIRTDRSSAHAAEAPVAVQLVAPGGKIHAEASAARGQPVRFDTAALRDGPYEIRCATRDLRGRLLTTHLPWFKGDAIAAARTLLATADQADAATPAGATLRMLADLVRDRLGKEGLAITGNPWGAIHSPLMEFAELQLEAAGDIAARARAGGFCRLAWRDETDGSVQYARAYLPPGYDAAKPWPLVIRLHGFNPPNPLYVRWWSVDSRHSLADAEYGDGQGVIFLEPHGRGNASYVGFGGADVVRAIAEARARFNVDADRVYLTGESMGGWGTWNVAVRQPQLFAAIAPIFGGADYHSYLPEEQLAALSPLRRFLQEKQSSWAPADSLLTMPIFVLHGDADATVDVAYSRYGVRLLQRWGYNVRYHEMPGYGHEDLNRTAAVIDWFLQHQRDPQPRHVRLRSAELPNAAAYWATVDAFDRPDEFMAVDAEVVGPNTIRVDSTNVVALTLTPGAGLIDPAKPVKIVWNGQPRDSTMTGGCLVLHAAHHQPAARAKTRALGGPIGDILRTPFAIVVGTVSSDPAMKDACRRQADAFAAYWQAWQHQPARVFLDTELTPALAQTCSLLLLGGPEANAVTRQLADALPLQLSASEVKIGGHAFAAREARVQLLHAHPRNLERYVLVVAATSAAALRRWQPGTVGSLDFDFLIEDDHVADIGQTADQTDLAVAAGWFDRNWAYDETLVHRGDAGARAQALHLGGLLEPKALAAYLGRYEVSPTLTLTLERQDDHLLVNDPSSTPLELVPAGDDRFYLPAAGAVLRFERDAAGKITRFVSAHRGREFSARKLD